MARSFARNELHPMAPEHDQSGVYPLETLQKAWEIRLGDTHVPEHCGSLGLGGLDGCILAEETAWGGTGSSTAIEVNILAASTLIVAGSKSQQRRCLDLLTEEFTLAAHGVTESGSGPDAIS